MVGDGRDPPRQTASTMKWSFRLLTVAGTQVRVHATFLLLLAYFAWQDWHNGPMAAAVAVLYVCAVFTCILLHEFGHVTAARKFGILTPDITLLPIGGMARMERMPRSPVQEIIVAIAGPAVNVVIAGVLFLIVGLPKFDAATFSELRFGSLHNFLLALATTNLFLVAFNLIPAFPMDGGRVLRALLALFLPYPRATRVAATIGQGLALCGAAFALFSNAPTLVILSIFIFVVAGREADSVDAEQITDHLPLSRAIMTRFQVLPASATFGDAADALLAGAQHDFPIVDASGNVLGILLRRQLLDGISATGTDTTALLAATPQPPSLTADIPLTRALEIFRDSGCPTLPVLHNESRKLVGLLTEENVSELLALQAAIDDFRSRSAA